MEFIKTQIDADSIGEVFVLETTTEDSSIVAEDASTNDENTEAVASTGGADDTSVTVSTEKEPWPEGGVDSFTNHALPSLVFGMLGIFLVLGLIAIATVSLNKLFPGKKQ